MIIYRYVLKEILQVFLFALLSLFGLYSMIDYSMHMQMLVESSSLTFSKLLLYYTLQFSKRIDLLFPISLLIATFKVLYSMNLRSELIAFTASGISLKRLIRPLLHLSALLTLLNLFNFEFLLPRALCYIDKFEKKYRAYSITDPKRNQGIITLLLNDGTKLVSQRDENGFHDAYWILGSDEIYHAKRLDPPTGEYVDHYKRNDKGVMELASSHNKFKFDNLNLKNAVAPKEITPHENRSISGNFRAKSDRYSNKTYFLFKLIMPFVSPILVMAIVPFITRYSRHHRMFLTFALSLFGLIATFTMMDACVIIGCAHLISPYIAMLTLPSLLIALFTKRFLRWS